MNYQKQKLSLKALLATEQCIPGFGNGVLQDILFNAEIHPKRKIQTLNGDEKKVLFIQIKNTLNEMAIKGGRDTEKDLFGQSGKYITKMSKNTMGKSCLVCGNPIKKEAYLGGSIYFCSNCQKINISYMLSKTSFECPAGVTFGNIFTINPCSFIINVDLIIPKYVLLYIFFSPQAPYISAAL